MNNFEKNKKQYEELVVEMEFDNSLDVLLSSGGEYSIDELADGFMDDFFGD